MEYIRRRLSETNLGLTGADNQQTSTMDAAPSNGYMVPTANSTTTNSAASTRRTSESGTSRQGETVQSADQPQKSKAGFFSGIMNNPAPGAAQPGPKLANAASTASNFLSNMASAVNVSNLKADSTSKCLLVIENRSTDWGKAFANKTVQGMRFRVEQHTFDDLTIIATNEGMVQACSRKLRDDNKEIRFRPDFILIRQQPVSKQHRIVLLGLKLGGIPSINSLHSIYNMFDPPWVFAQLARIRMRFGSEFPVTTKTFMPSANCLRRFRDFPAIVSSSNRSDARLRVRNRDQVEDIIPILQQIDDYIMVEPLVKAAYELHVTRIGGIYSVYVQTSPQEGNAVVERVEITPRYKLWIDAVCELFGGLDIAGIRAIHTADGRDIIVNVESSWLNLPSAAAQNDEALIVDVIVKKMELASRPQSIAKNVGQTVVNPHHKKMASEPCTPERPTPKVRQSLPCSPEATRKNTFAANPLDGENAEKIRDMRNSFMSYFNK